MITASDPTAAFAERKATDNDGLLSLLLDEQRQLTAVETFSREHESGCIPSQARYYSKLLPASPPGEGQQYAFEVDLDRCTGCKACVSACHSLNGLDEQETWRDVGLLIGGTSVNPVMQHVTTACHHCLEPACMIACPVDAYEKDPATGIVRHLDDQCFGCQYCTLACPYDVPKYHHDKGIVRKCDMCSDRLAVGEAPACVQACPNEAIAIKVVNVTEVRENAEADPFLPAAPEPHQTFPTTTYRTSRVFPRNTLPADYYSVNPQHPHWPLIVMLVLTQLSVGAFSMGMLVEEWLPAHAAGAFRPIQATSALAFGLLALGASVFHLGRPQFAFRAIIGLKHSWLSREIVAFGMFAVAAVLYAASTWLPGAFRGWKSVLKWGVLASGFAGVLCSVMIYVFTQREYWSFRRTLTRFALTAAVLGIAATWLTILVMGQGIGDVESRSALLSLGPLLARGLIIASICKLCSDLSLLRQLADRRNTPLRRSARLMIGPLSNVTLARSSAGILGGIVMPGFLLQSFAAAQPPGDLFLLLTVTILFLACLLGELLERYLFFAAVSSPRMPGGLRP